MGNERLREDIFVVVQCDPTHPYADLLNRCYAALGELDTSMLPAEAQAGLALQRNEIDRLKQQLRAEGDRIAELNAKLGEQQSVPDAVRDALARRCLWLAFVWNDHNFQSAHIEARKEAEKHGITSFDDANEWLSAPSPVQKPAQQSAGVVMPERKDDQGAPTVNLHIFREGWNACLDEFARLNGKEVCRG